MAKSVFEILMKIDGDQKVKKAIKELGTAAGLTGAALTAFSTGVAKTASDYEYSLAKVGTLADETTGTLQEFDNAVFNLSEQMNGAISANEAAAASYDVLSAGYKDQADVMAILEKSQKAAIGGYSDLATVSDASTTIMNAYGDVLGENLSVTEKMTMVTDQMIQTQNLGKITADEYSRYIGSIASSAASLKIPFEEMNASIAVATAQGVRVSSTFAGMGQIMAALSKPTKEAQDQAAALGIEFNAAAVESKGLSGVLQDIVDSGGASQESLGRLFGSVEAVRVVTPLLSQEGAVLNKALEGMADSAGTATVAFDKMSLTTEQRVKNALNTLQNSFIKLGQGVLIAIEPVIKTLSFLVDKFAELPAPVLQVIGALTALTGITLTTIGAIALATTAIASISGSIGLFVGALTSAQVAIKGFIAYNGITTAALGTLALQLGLVVAAIGAVALAYDSLREKGTQFNKNTQNIRDSIREAREELGKFNEEQKSSEGDDSGDIKPKRKFYDIFGNEEKKRLNDYRINVRETTQSVLELSDEINGLGDSQAETSVKQKLFQDGLKEIDNAISKLDENELGTAVYEELRANLITSKNVLEQTAKAQGIVTESADGLAVANQNVSDTSIEAAISETELAEATQKAAEEFTTYTKSVNDFITALESQKNLEISKLSTSGSGIEESLKKELEITQTYNAKIIAAKESLAAQTQTTEADRVKAQSEINQMLADEAKKVFDTEQKLRELNNQKTLDALDTERNNVEQLFADKKILSADYNTALIDILNEELAFKLSVIDEELATAKQGSAEYFELQKERSKVILDTTNEAASINQKYNDEVQRQQKETLEETKRLEQEKLTHTLDTLNLELEANKNTAQAILENRQLASDQLANQEQFSSGLEGILSRISNNLEKDNLTLEQRNQLEKVSQDVLSKSAELGLQVNSSLTLEQQIQEALNALEIKKLDIKKQQLQITQEIIKAESESAALDLQGNIEISQQKLTDTSLTDTERQSLQQEIDLNQKKLELLNKQTEAKLKANEASLSLLELEKSLTLTEQSISQNPALNPETQAPAVTPTATTTGSSEGDTLANEKLERTAQATQETTDKLDKVSQGTDTLPMANEKLTSLETLTATGNENLGSLNRSVEANNQAVTGSTTTLNSTLQTINSSIQSNGVTLNSINNAINNLPRQIAASIPRPAPPTPVPSR